MARSVTIFFFSGDLRFLVKALTDHHTIGFECSVAVVPSCPAT